MPVYLTWLPLVTAPMDAMQPAVDLTIAVVAHTPVPEGVSVNMRGPENLFHKH